MARKSEIYAENLGKRPRHYLAAYRAARGDKEAEREALSGLPVEWRPLLKTYIQIHKERNNESSKRGQV